MGSPANKRALYAHADGKQEWVSILKEHSDAEGNGFTIYIPSLQRERQTVEKRLDFTATEEAPVEQHEEQQHPQPFETQMSSKRVSKSIKRIYKNTDKPFIFQWFLGVQAAKIGPKSDQKGI